MGLSLHMLISPLILLGFLECVPYMITSNLGQI